MTDLEMRLAKNGERYKREQPKDELQFNREALLTLNGAKCEKQEMIKCLLCFLPDIQPIRIETIKEDALFKELRQRFLLNVFYYNKHLFVEESREAFYNLRTHELSSAITQDDYFTDARQEWVMIPDYTIINGVSWKDLV